METLQKPDPRRAHAIPVYRYIRDNPGASLVEIADVCFPVPDGPRTSREAIAKRNLRHVITSIGYLREQGVDIGCSPSLPSGFQIGVVTAKVSAEVERVWGGSLLGIYHPE
jgi:hypothetical protein